LKFAVVVVVLIAAILANLYIQRDNEYKEFKDQEDALQRDIASIQHLYDQSQDFKQHIATIEGKLKGVMTLAAMQPPWPVIMDELGRVMRDSAWINEMHWDANGSTWEIHGFCLGTDEFQRLVVNMWHSDILKMVEMADIEPQGLDMDEGHLGGWFGDRGAGGGFGFNEWEPSQDDIQNGASSEFDQNLMDELTGNNLATPRPEPMYKLPEGGTASQDIEWYFQGHQYVPPIFYEFTFNGTVDPAVMFSGKDLFGDQLSDLVGGATPTASGPQVGSGIPGTPAQPGMPGGVGGGDSGGTPDEGDTGE
jgi:hypothetical protein